MSICVWAEGCQLCPYMYGQRVVSYVHICMGRGLSAMSIYVWAEGCQLCPYVYGQRVVSYVHTVVSVNFYLKKKKSFGLHLLGGKVGKDNVGI